MEPDAAWPLNRRGPPPARKPRTVAQNFKRLGIPLIATILSLATIIVIAFLIKAALERYYFLCSKSFTFIPLQQQCDGQPDCPWGEDEGNCVQHVPDGPPVGVRTAQDRAALQVLDRETGAWFWACHDNFDRTLAKAACKQMGYSSTATFSAVSIADTRGLPLREVTLSHGGLQGQDSGRQCLSGAVVSLVCAACGQSIKSPRVVGGGLARIEAWPWQVSLQHRTQHLCGGSIIGPSWILTAAHCFRNNLALQHWRVKAGSETLSSFHALPVEKIFLMDSKSVFPRDSDIALVKLAAPFAISDTVKPICLPSFDAELPPQAPLWVAGWGYAEQDGALSEALRQAQVQLVDSSSCNASAAYQGAISHEMICAGLVQGGVDTCQGDSGGPLMYNPGRWQVVGIVSWGHGCGRPSTPGVYTKVQAYLNWIYSVQRVSV
ncbi:transmembrane protease serine 4 isoform X2 [Pelodiscus sinensis]|uniref:transmembrane protease serine 4 isoform X2 n=1 Tax=Pelodiscus sinensis TaxID=13735 RepID=UPI003F6CFF01